jgi:hypothetical protein
MHFMSLLNHLWTDLYREPQGFVERWALRGPEAADDAWAEAETLSPKLKGKKHGRALFEVLKTEALLPLCQHDNKTCNGKENQVLLY